MAEATGSAVHAAEDTREIRRPPRIEITLNDEARFLPIGLTVAEALDALDLRQWVFMIELNGDLVRREEFDEVRIDEGDIVELIHMPYGG